jgi:hypothetical protein
MSALVRALRENSSVQFLDLGGNRLLFSGLKCFVEVLLQVNTSISQCDIVSGVDTMAIENAGLGEEMNALIKAANGYLDRNLKLLHYKIETELDSFLHIRVLGQIVCQYCDTNLPWL